MDVMLEKIRSALDSAGLTQESAEIQLGFPKGRISRWLNGTGEPRARQLWRLAKLVGYPLEYFVDDTMATPTKAERYTEEERALVIVARSMGVDNAIRRLTVPAYVQGQPIPGMTVTAVENPTQEQAREILRKRRTK